MARVPLSSTFDLIVVGAGVVGVATAYWAERAGLATCVIDRRGGPARETSFANGAQLSVSHATPWASPQALAQIAGWLVSRDAPLHVAWRAGLSDAAWLVAFVRNATPARARANLIAAVRLAAYSRAQMDAIDAAEALDYGRRASGIVHIYRDPRAYAAGVRAAEIMTAHGGPRAPLQVSDLIARDRAFTAIAPDLAGATCAPLDGVGDPHVFATAMTDRLARRGVALGFDAEATELAEDAGGVSVRAFMEGRAVTLRARRVALCLGVATPDLLARRQRPPIIPVKGYSATIPITDAANAPRAAVIDDEHKLVYATLGDRLRVAGMAEVRGRDRRLDPRRAESLVARARATFPEAGDYDRASFWTGLRPMTPSGLPVIGPAAPGARVWINAGHGALGWTMAAGAGRLLIDHMLERTAEIPWPPRDA